MQHDSAYYQNQLTIANTWDAMYKLGMDIYEHAEFDGYEKRVIDILHKATMRYQHPEDIDNDEYFNARKILVKLYFSCNDYRRANNVLVLLEQNCKKIPDWAYLYRAMCQIKILLQYTAEEPRVALFSFLDSISSNDVEIVRYRADVCKEYLHLLVDNFEYNVAMKDCIRKNGSYILQNAKIYGLNDDVYEVREFKAAFGMENKPLTTEFSSAHDDGQNTHSLCVKYDSSAQENKSNTVDEKSEISILLQENEQLKALIEKEQNKNQRIAEQFKKERVAKEKAQADLALKAAIISSSNYANVEVSKPTPEDIIGAGADIQNIVNKMHAEFMETRTPIVNRDKCPAHDLLTRRGKIYVVGDNDHADIDALCKIAKDNYGFLKTDFEFDTDYDKTKNAVSAKIHKWDSKYNAIIVGSTPHKTTATGDYSSWVERFAAEEGYPPIFKATDDKGRMVLKKNSFNKALADVVRYLRSTPTGSQF